MSGTEGIPVVHGREEVKNPRIRTNHDPAGVVRGTKRVRVQIETLFHRDRDKQQAAALWAADARDRFGWR
jgi:hypothetical protein